MKTSFIPSPNLQHSISQPKPTVRFGMNHPKETAPSGDTVSFQTPQAHLSKEQLQAHWDKVLQALESGMSGSNEMSIAQKRMDVVQRIVPQIPTAQLREFLQKRSNLGYTVLHMAALADHPAVMSLLLETYNDLGAHPDELLELLTNAHWPRETALHNAADSENPAMMTLLLKTLRELEPDPAKLSKFLQKRSEYGFTALDQAIRGDNTNNAAILRAYEADLTTSNAQSGSYA